mmetsp:Transcript_13998/g.19427  ORF Transcript_13998/g.19427 Transcript_13998/m.19427 type:complete len:741 (+) Transcript_13998:1100-3322(+)
MEGTRNCPKCNSLCPAIGLFCPKCGMAFDGKRPPKPNGGTKPPPFKKEEQSAENIEKMMRIRQKVAEEIISSEKTYIKALDTVCENFLNPLKKAVQDGKPVISLNDIQMVFSVISVIRDLNKKFLADLEPLIQDYTLETRIGKVILDFAPYFKMYTQYVNAHENDKAQAYMRRLDTKAPNSSFKSFCWDVAKTEGCLPLPALLITPVQRIPRYRLLVQEYLKNTDPSHSDYDDLENALEKIKETATIINEAVRRQQQRQTVLDLETKFSSNPHFISPSRVFLRQGPLWKKCRADDRKYEFFLFNDLLVYGRITGKDRYALHKKIPIDQTFNVTLLPEAPDPNSFQILNSVKSFVVYAETVADMESWIKSLRDTIEKRANALNKGETNFVAPVWESDKKKDCQRQFKPDGTRCETSFSLFNRRHHCRRCGVLCCHDCSPYNVYLTKESKKKERACTACIRVLMDLDINKTLYKEDQLPNPALTNHLIASATAKMINSESSLKESPRAVSPHYSKSASMETHGQEQSSGRIPPPPPPVRPSAKAVPSKPKQPPPLRRRNMNNYDLGDSAPSAEVLDASVEEDQNENTNEEDAGSPEESSPLNGNNDISTSDPPHTGAASLVRRVPPSVPRPPVPKIKPPPKPPLTAGQRSPRQPLPAQQQSLAHASEEEKNSAEPPERTAPRRPPVPWKVSGGMEGKKRLSRNNLSMAKQNMRTGVVGKLKKGHTDKLAALMAKFQQQAAVD